MQGSDTQHFYFGARKQLCQEAFRTIDMIAGYPQWIDFQPDLSWTLGFAGFEGKQLLLGLVLAAAAWSVGYMVTS